MGHRIVRPRADLVYSVVDMDGYTISWHRTEHAAQRAIDAEWRGFRRRYPADGSRGNATAYLPRSIIHCDGTAQYIERLATYSTSWG